MINLFNIKKPVIDFNKFDHNLHGTIVTELENQIADYLDVKYCVATNSCTSAIFLVCKWYQHRFSSLSVKIPTMLPVVVPNALSHAGVGYNFIDNTDWIGGHYYINCDSVFSIIDSAHEFSKDAISEYNQEMSKRRNDNTDRWAALYSFYPTKPISGIDGGMIATNSEELAEWLRIAIMNGTSWCEKSWQRKNIMHGWKYYMSSAQAYVALESFKEWPKKKARLEEIRAMYDHAFDMHHSSEHLYRVVGSRFYNGQKKHDLKESGIETGIHYPCLHTQKLFRNNKVLERSEKKAHSTISIPYHEALTDKEVAKVISVIKKYYEL